MVLLFSRNQSFAGMPKRARLSACSGSRPNAGLNSVSKKGHKGSFWIRTISRKSLLSHHLAAATTLGTPSAKPSGMTILSFSRSDVRKMNRWGFALLAAGMLAAVGPANAQIPRGLPVPGLPKRQQQTKVPPAYRPPAGMCRIWIEGVPANQQPAPTDCVNAVRNRPVNGTVIFGADAPKRGNDKSRKGKSKKDSDDSPDQ